jgi:hypothetical protein
MYTKGIKVKWSLNIVHALDKVDFFQPNDYFVLQIWKCFKWMCMTTTIYNKPPYNHAFGDHFFLWL